MSFQVPLKTLRGVFVVTAAIGTAAHCGDLVLTDAVDDIACDDDGAFADEIFEEDDDIS
jgi:hypothetical protein